MHKRLEQTLYSRKSRDGRRAPGRTLGVLCHQEMRSKTARRRRRPRQGVCIGGPRCPGLARTRDAGLRAPRVGARPRRPGSGIPGPRGAVLPLPGVYRRETRACVCTKPAPTQSLLSETAQHREPSKRPSRAPTRRRSAAGHRERELRMRAPRRCTPGRHASRMQAQGERTLRTLFIKTRENARSGRQGADAFPQSKAPAPEGTRAEQGADPRPRLALELCGCCLVASLLWAAVSSSERDGERREPRACSARTLSGWTNARCLRRGNRPSVPRVPGLGGPGASPRCQPR